MDYITIFIYAVVFAIFALFLLMMHAIAHLAHLSGQKGRFFWYMPVLNLYFAGKIIRTINISGFKVPFPEWIAPAVPVIFVSLYYQNHVSPIMNSSILAIIYFILAIVWLYFWNTFFLTFRCSPKKALIYALAGGIFLLPLPLFIWSVRNIDPIYEDDNT